MSDLARVELSTEDCLALVASTRRGRLVGTAEALPSATPVPYIARDGDIVVRVLRTERVRDGDVFSLLVDRIEESSGAGWSVLVTGSARVVSGDERLVERLAAHGTSDWVDGDGVLVLLTDPLVRGESIGTPGRCSTDPRGSERR